MNEKDELMKVLQSLSGGAKPQGPDATVGKVVAQLEHITGYLQHLEQGVVKMAAEVQRCSLLERLFAKKLIEKGVMTEEEFQTAYHDEVYAPMQVANEEFQAKMREATEQARQAQEAVEAAKVQTPVLITPVSVEEEPEDTGSTVVLASERFKRQS